MEDSEKMDKKDNIEYDVGGGWNYRVVYHPPSKYGINGKEFDRDEYLAVHEVFYNKDGIPSSMTIDEILTGDEGVDSLKSLKWIIEEQLKSLKRKILYFDAAKETYEEISEEKQNEFSKSIECEL